MQEILQKEIQKALSELFGVSEAQFSVEQPKEMSHGDYATNAPLAVAKQLGKSPKEVADALIEKLQNIENVVDVSVAGAGFINFILKPEYFSETVSSVLNQKNDWGKSSIYLKKKIMIEYTDPNPFKPFHIGHLMTNAIGESIARILEIAGAHVIRANYQGDVGLHVAKAFYGMQKKGMPSDMDAPAAVLAEYIGEAYAIGSEAFDTEPEAKKEIQSLNKRIYDRTDEEVNQVYEWGRKVTLEAFEEIYKILGTKFDYYFFESEMAHIGIRLVKDNIGNIFEESEGAIVFKAKKYNPKLHTRVFITSQGLPTYETKELGLTKTKFEKETLDTSIVVTAVEQKDYMEVATEAMRQIDASLADRMRHLTHGMMRFASGKMSSRTGNVITGESLLKGTKNLVSEKIADRNLMQEEKDYIAELVSVAAIKFAILRQAIGGDIIYDEERAISFEGDSGPYLQYSAVRAQSILNKREQNVISANLPKDWETSTLEKTLIHFPEIVERSIKEWAPHHVVSYLLELAQAFNSWYGNTKIIDATDASAYKLALTQAFAQTMHNGLYLLGIKVPEKM